MGMTSVLSEASTNSTTTIPQLSSGSSGSIGELSVELGLNNSEGVSSCLLAFTGSAVLDGTTNDEPTVVVILKRIKWRDTTPYSRTENQANLFYHKLLRKQPNTNFPVIICENEDAVSAMKSVFGSCDRDKMVDTLNILEKMIGGKYDA